MSKSVEKRHAIQKGHRPMDQMEYQGIIWVIKSDADKRIAELKTSITGIPRYSMAGIGLHFPNDAEECVWINITEIESVLSEGGADE